MKWWVRPLAVLGVGAVCLGVVWGTVWGIYGFRYSMTPDPGLRAEFKGEMHMARASLLWKRGGIRATTAEAIATEPLPAVMRGAMWANEKRLIPEGFARGFIFTYASTIVRGSFLLDEMTLSGRWTYFPIALGVKWPLGLLALFGLAAVMAWWRGSVELTGVAVLAGFYLLLAITGGINLGIRHLLPTFPLLLAMLAVVVGRQLQAVWETRKQWKRSGGSKWGVGLAGVLWVAWVGMVGEVLGESPRFLSFFNAPARAYGPHRILGDSNLDWGQDLPLLRDWQARNPEEVLSLSYFGSVSPEAYGIRYVPAQGTWMPRRALERNLPPGVFAMSVTNLQETLIGPEDMGVFANIRAMKPMEILGGTIFLYRTPPRVEDVDAKRWPMRYVEPGGGKEMNLK
jgi:hypothetical protein